MEESKAKSEFVSDGNLALAAENFITDILAKKRTSCESVKRFQVSYFDSPYAANNFQPHLLGFPRFAALSHATLARGKSETEQQRAF